jgi:hypothetical protein
VPIRIQRWVLCPSLFVNAGFFCYIVWIGTTGVTGKMFFEKIPVFLTLFVLDEGAKSNE